MTVKRTELTKAMRRVLERMEKGCVVVLSQFDHLVWGDTGAELHDGSVLDILVYAKYIKDAEVCCWKILPAGRKALKETGR